MAILEEPEPKNVAKDFYIGKTHVRIATDYCQDRTKEEVDKILRRIARDAQRALSAKYMEEQSNMCEEKVL